MKNKVQQEFLFQQVGHCARLVHAAVRPHYQKGMQPFDLKPSEFAVLSLLAENTSLPQKNLSEALKISQPNMAALVDRLEQRSLVVRGMAEDDRRVTTVALTDPGQALYLASQAAVQQLEDEAVAMLTAEEKNQLLQLLAKVVRG
jgi:DNA-binding MarR family transcriptional regulator